MSKNAKNMLAVVVIALIAVAIGAAVHSLTTSAPKHHHTSGRSGPNRATAAAASHGRLIGCRASGASVVYHGSRSRRLVALTFDDGPWGTPSSIEFVDELHRLGAVGTFFEIGDQIARYDPTGAVERAMLADGDMIGDHSWSHPDLLRKTRNQQDQELRWQQYVVHQKTGFTECLFRPPYAYFDSELTQLARSLGMATIQWDVDTDDWERPGVAKIASTAITDAKPGSIIIMHFGGGDRYETLDALPKIVHTLRSEGYSFVTITTLLGYKLVYS